jgi:CRISPR-associated endonuclease Cas1
MVATQTVPQHLEDCNSPASISPRHGVVTLFGFGIKTYVDRGHLVLEDGVGPIRRHARFARVRHGLRRVVIIGSDGFVSLAALRWLADQGASLVMLDRLGEVLTTTGPVCPTDARLRRAQALAPQSGAALEISRSLVQQKLVQQERIIRERFHDSPSAAFIAQTRLAQSKANSIDEVRHHEAVAAKCYWLAWRSLVVNYPKIDLPRVPDHWRKFGTRQSPITGSPRRAVNPPNAVLNYLYSLLQSESRLALAALGLDPGMGVLHTDTPNRDSLACDLMETARPLVDIYVHDWIKHETLRRSWFFEQHDGNCRLMGPFAELLSGTAQMWQRAIAPHAEWIARTLWKTQAQSRRGPSLATRLTQARRRTAQGGDPVPPSNPGPRPIEVCLTCGARVSRDANYCAQCTGNVSRENLLEAARLGRIAAQSPDAAAHRSDTQKKQHALRKTWNLTEKPDWLTKKTYHEKILPYLSKTRVAVIASALAVSLPYATDIRSGKRIPHPRHWQTLADIVSTFPHSTH